MNHALVLCKPFRYRLFKLSRLERASAGQSGTAQSGENPGGEIQGYAPRPGGRHLHILLAFSDNFHRNGTFFLALPAQLPLRGKPEYVSRRVPLAEVSEHTLPLFPVHQMFGDHPELTAVDT